LFFSVFVLVEGKRTDRGEGRREREEEEDG
jgi:hypothetical protein